MSDTNQTITTFYEQAQDRNFARDYQFRIGSFVLDGNETIDEEDLVFMKTANLPGKEIYVQKAGFMGLDFNIPGSVKFDGSDSWEVTFYCTQDYYLKTFFDTSIKNTFDHNQSGGNYDPKDLGSNVIDVILLDDQLNAIKQYTLFGCFVTSVKPIAFDVTGTGKPVDITATIAYQFWEETEPGVSTSIFPTLLRTPGITIPTNVRDILSVVNQFGNLGRLTSQLGIGNSALNEVNKVVNGIKSVEKNVEKTVGSAINVANKISKLFNFP